jgi:hydrogenase maturation protease
MSLELVERIANAVLYEGYILYPYRASSVKNRRRFNFGVLFPPAYSAVQSGTESSTMRTECLVRGGAGTRLDVRLRFLQVTPVGDPDASLQSWQNALEREVNLRDYVLDKARLEPFHFPIGEGLDGRVDAGIEGTLTVSALPLQDGLFRISVSVVNKTAFEYPEESSRDGMLPYSFAAAHTILAVRDGEFVSLLDPPNGLKEAASACNNTGTWPVLAGEPGQPAFMLSSPIILYDYPQIAPESPGDLFDGTEIDEILTLRIMTLTDEEKAEVRNGDERARRILERTEMLPEEHFMKLHGALRGLRPVEGSR